MAANPLVAAAHDSTKVVVRGRVVDAAGAPVAMASVVLGPGLHLGTETAVDGSYAMIVPVARLADQRATLTVRHIGYHPLSDTIGLDLGRTITRDFTLAPQALSLSQVVVTNADGARETSDTAAAGGVAGNASPTVDAAARKSAAPPVARAEYMATATSSAPRRLALIQSGTIMEDGHVVQRRIYEVRPGVRVTLDIRGTTGAQPVPAVKRSSQPIALEPVMMPAESIAVGVSSIQWTGADGAEYILSGRLPVSELKAIKALVR
jgi:hypothetical protein